MGENGDGVTARCWVLTQAGVDAVRPPRLVPRSEATRKIIDDLIAADLERAP